MTPKHEAQLLFVRLPSPFLFVLAGRRVFFFFFPGGLALALACSSLL